MADPETTRGGVCHICGHDLAGHGAPTCSAWHAADHPTTIAVGETWRSPKTWWRIAVAWGGAVIVEGPRGSVRGSRDGGETWSEPEAVMTREGFLAWVRKTGAVKL